MLFYSLSCPWASPVETVNLCPKKPAFARPHPKELWFTSSRKRRPISQPYMWSRQILEVWSRPLRTSTKSMADASVISSNKVYADTKWKWMMIWLLIIPMKQLFWCRYGFFKIFWRIKNYKFFKAELYGIWKVLKKKCECFVLTSFFKLYENALKIKDYFVSFLDFRIFVKHDFRTWIYFDLFDLNFEYSAFPCFLKYSGKFEYFHLTIFFALFH